VTARDENVNQSAVPADGIVAVGLSPDGNSARPITRSVVRCYTCAVYAQ
jgi:hypothetical protein